MGSCCFFAIVLACLLACLLETGSQVSQAGFELSYVAEAGLELPILSFPPPQC